MPHIPDSHADHDPLAIAAYAAGDATGPELELAAGLVARCAACAALHHDLRAIATAVTALPAPVRPRDFRLAPEQAAALRPSGWRRFLAPLAGPRFAFAGPLGTGLATLGVAGLLVAGSLGAPVAAPSAADGAGGAAATERVTTMLAPATDPVLLEGAAPASMAPVEAPVPAASDVVAAPVGGAGAAGSGGEASIAPASQGGLAYGAAGEEANASPEGARSAAGPGADPERAGTATAPVADAAPASAVLPVLAGLMLAAGLLLGAARLLARRLT